MFDRKIKTLQKNIAAEFKDSQEFAAMTQLPLMQIVNRLNGIKNKFSKIAFIGPNPHLFLLNCPKHYGTLEEFTFIESSEKSVEHSYRTIERLIDSGALPENKQPDKIEPKVMCEETEWKE